MIWFVLVSVYLIIGLFCGRMLATWMNETRYGLLKEDLKYDWNSYPSTFFIVIAFVFFWPLTPVIYFLSKSLNLMFKCADWIVKEIINPKENV